MSRNAMSPRRASRIAAAAAAGLIVTLVAACSGSSSSTPSGNASSTPASAKLEKTSIVVGAVPGEGAAGLFIAQKQGLFAKQGLSVTIMTTTSANTVIPDLLRGTVDVDSGQWSSIIAAQAAGAGTFHALANGFALGPHAHEIVALPSSGITSPAQLKGKTIAVNALNGLTTDLALAALSAYGITQSEVHFVAIPFPAMFPALAAHRVDAAYVIEPYVTAAEQAGAKGLVDIDGTPATSVFPINGYAVTTAWMAKYPNTAAAFARAVEEGNTVAATDPAVMRAVLAGALHTSTKITDVMATGSFPVSVSAAGLQRVAALMQRYGQLKHSFDVSALTG
jgi:NitT/TauT family transport system substrate-binding protein